jgi:hypothetical protein
VPDHENYLRSDVPVRPEREEYDDRDDDRRPYRRSRFDVRRQSHKQDRDHLRILSIFYYVAGALLAVLFALPLFYVAFGVAIVTGIFAPPGNSSGPPLAVMGWILICVGGAVVLLGWAAAGCLVAAGRCLAAHRAYMFCFVVACIACLWAPPGTILGVFTIIVLVRPSVKELFEATRAGVAEPAPRPNDDY